MVKPPPLPPFAAAVLLLVSTFPSSVPREESQILLQIKKEWANPPSLSSWTDPSSSSSSSTSAHCGWNGVECNSNGSVISLSLVDQGIRGSVPAATCELKNLSSLNLYNNSIGGGFPTSLYDCKNLRELNLSQNLLVGGIPGDVSRLSSLQLLDLSYNNLSGDIPAAIALIPGLRHLSLQRNLFNGSFPKELGEMAALEYLSLAINPFRSTMIPPELGRMKKLKFLWISQASLVGPIPETIGDLTELEHLNLAMNNLSGTVPAKIWQLGKLQKLFLYENKLSGEIHEVNALNLTKIDLCMNNLSGPMPEGFGKLLNLNSLVLYNNKFTGQIPQGISKIPNLEDIRLFNNLFTGVVPPELGQHSKLIYLEVDGNRLQGGLPENLCANGALNSVAAFDNQLTGSLPESLGHCQTLRYIQLQGNRLSGEIPAGIWSLPSLDFLRMGGNEFAGELPETLPPSLSRLEIENNMFSGRLPLSSQSLKIFWASNNSFSGELPSNLTVMAQIDQLLLDGNRISGEIPPAIQELTAVTVIDLSRNRLSGRIPGELGSLSQLTSLDLSENQLSEGIPPEIGSLKLSFLDLSSNSLSGEVPTALQIAAYDGSFRSNPRLCTFSTSPLNLPPCAGAGAGSGGIPRWLLTLVLVLAAVVIFCSSLSIFLIRGHRRGRKPTAADLLASWKFTSFQLVDFRESAIIRGLHSGNLIGSGGSGQVYRIPTGGRATAVVAVKKIWSAQKMMNPKLSQEFLSEVNILGSIRHTNIVKLLAFVSGADSMLLVYEFMANGSLEGWLHSASPEKREALDWPRRLSIAIGVAQGLCYMHHDCNPPIIHRDVKSSNILLDSEFCPKVADFGLARFMDGAGEPELASSVAGSVGYMAPECAYSRRVNEKADVYSFGVVLLELITKKPASEGQSSLVEWAWRRFQESATLPLEETAAAATAQHLEQMTAVLRLALFCTGTLPSARPSMKEVLQVLLRLAEKEESQNQTAIAVEHDVAPLLRYASKNRSRRKSPSGGPDGGEGDDDLSNILSCNNV
ncbi:unnamed protein product [Spirodela intermedia]|uniref:non-specific serine/threonine protein kinase n=1 Tax=Spirodela intermedia TaxID=51605 RepID=A0A7I8KES4_SPIIN|nr:unnamed protein product [Spirodela intermedia]